MKKKNMVTLILGIAAGVLATITAYVQHVEKMKQEKEAQKYQKKFEQAQAKTIELLEQQNDSLSEVKKLNEQIAGLQEKNTGLQNELYNIVTGAKNYPILIITGNKSRGFKDIHTEETIDFFIIKFNLINPWKYPLNSVKVDFADHQGFYIGQFITVTKNSISQAPDPRFSLQHPFSEQSIYIGTLPNNTVERDFYITTTPTRIRQSYNVKIN